jgi:hypothetical protein
MLENRGFWAGADCSLGFGAFVPVWYVFILYFYAIFKRKRMLSYTNNFLLKDVMLPSPAMMGWNW